MQANMWFEHKVEKASQVNGAGEEELGCALQKVLPDALMQAIQQLVLRDVPPTKAAGYAAVAQNVHENVPKAEISEETLSFLLGE